MYTTPITTPALIAAFADSICGDKDHADPDFDRLPNDACTYPKVVLVNDDGTFAFVHFKPSMNLDAIIYNPPNSTTIEIARRERAKEAGMKTEEYEGESKAVWRAKVCGRCKSFVTWYG